MSCARLDRDHVVIVQDFGPKGFVGPVNTKLTQGLTPGGTVTVVAASDHELFLNILDGQKNRLIHLGARPYNDTLVFNSWFKSVWGVEEKPAKNSIQKGQRVTVTMVYEVLGYRVFINGREEVFYKHRSDATPSILECVGGIFYKVIYMNAMELTP